MQYNDLLEDISMQAKIHLPNTLTVCYHSQYALVLLSSKPFVQIVVVERVPKELKGSFWPGQL